MPTSKGYVFVGPQNFFVYKDVAYKPGDAVPMTAEEFEHNRQHGSAQFDGHQPIFTAPVNGTPDDLVPSDDMGRPMVLGPNGQILKPGSNAWKDAMAARGMPKEAIDAQADAAKAGATSAPVPSLAGAVNP